MDDGLLRCSLWHEPSSVAFGDDPNDTDDDDDANEALELHLQLCPCIRAVRRVERKFKIVLTL
jgi:hypothetical protein